MLQQVPVIIFDLIDAVVEEESMLIAAEQIKIGKEYIRIEKVSCIYCCCNMRCKNLEYICTIFNSIQQSLYKCKLT